MLKSFFQTFSSRLILFLCFILCTTAIGYALYSQFIDNAEPCPLCIAQRVVYFLIGLIALIGAIQGPKKFGCYIYGLLVTLFGGGGVAMAHHHIYLQNLPPDQWPMSCGMPLEVQFQQLPLTGFIHTVLSGSAECAMIDWTVLGVSGVKISLAGFILLTFAGIYLIIQRMINQRA